MANSTHDSHEIEMMMEPNNLSKNGDNGIDSKANVWLSWEDLWVTVSDQKGKTKAILEGVTGFAIPAQLLAIMGPSGSGKSTLLDALAGRLGSNTKQTGQILMNGHKQALAYGTSAYVTQDETLLATLTVRESVYYSSELQLPESMSKWEKRKRGEECIKEMGLEKAMETKVGGWGVKGLSGGQKRRLSICIQMLTRPKLVFLDEPTSGLDSAASLHVLSRIASTLQTDGTTIIASIHQPSTQVFALFHHLCLLSQGKTLYFGPASQANELFASNGFPCPPLQNPSDHFLEMINNDFDHEDVEVVGLHGKSREDIVDTLLTSYTSSQYYQQVRGLISTMHKQKGEKLETRSRKHASFVRQCKVLTKRSFVNMNRDLGYYWLRLGVYIILGLGLGTIFFKLGFNYNSIQARGSFLMFVASFLTFMAIGGFPSFVEDMKVFKVERLNGHYGTTAFVISNTISSMPYLLLIGIIPGSISYYLAGLQRGYQHFIYYTSIIFTSMLLVESLMLIVASIVPHFLMGIITGAGIQGLMILGGGFFRLRNDLPRVFWRYPLYYISFHRYAYQGLFKNEFEGLEFPTTEGNMTGGEDILNKIFQVENNQSKWFDLVILVGMVVVYRVLFLAIVKISEIMKSVSISAVTKRPLKQIVVEST